MALCNQLEAFALDLGHVTCCKMCCTISKSRMHNLQISDLNLTLTLALTLTHTLNLILTQTLNLILTAAFFTNCADSYAAQHTLLAF